jgi:opacity protein-like surface antigen
MKSTLVIAAALALCGSAFAANAAQQKHGVLDTVKQDAHQIGSSFRQDFHRVARGDKFRQEQAAAQRAHPQTHAMGAGGADSSMSSGRQARMDAAYANWQRSHR